MFESKENYRAVGVEDTMVATVPYSTTGYLYRNVYFGDGSSADSACSSISSVEGFPVNTCMVGYNVAFKYQLTQGKNSYS